MASSHKMPFSPLPHLLTATFLFSIEALSSRSPPKSFLPLSPQTSFPPLRPSGPPSSLPPADCHRYHRRRRGEEPQAPSPFFPFVWLSPSPQGLLRLRLRRTRGLYSRRGRRHLCTRVASLFVSCGGPRVLFQVGHHHATELRRDW